MCRTPDFHGFQYRDHRTRLKIKAFYVRLSRLSLRPNKPLPESLTLAFPARIDETELSIDGSKIRSDSPAFVALHREVSSREAVFGTRERIQAGEAVRFEVFLREEKVLEGMFRRDEEEEWRLEVRSGVGEVGAAAADVCVGLEGHVALCERVEIVYPRKAKKNMERRRIMLEMIPEGREEVVDDENDRLDGLCCRDCEGGYGSDGGGREEALCGGDCERMEMDLEGVRWAVDVGIWVMCFGVGYLVSKASAKSLGRSLRRSRMIL